MSRRWARLQRVDPTFHTLFDRAGDCVVAAADALYELFRDGLIDEQHFVPLDDIEHRADSNTRDILNHLERGNRAPFSDDATRRLIVEIDEIVDFAETAGELAVLTGVENVTPVALSMAELLVRAAHEVESLLRYVEHSDGYRPYVVRIHELENEGDALWTSGFKELFDGSHEPLDVIRWMQIYDALEAALDSCESSARQLERAILERGG